MKETPYIVLFSRSHFLVFLFRMMLRSQSVERKAKGKLNPCTSGRTQAKGGWKSFYGAKLWRSKNGGRENETSFWDEICALFDILGALHSNSHPGNYFATTHDISPSPHIRKTSVTLNQAPNIAKDFPHFIGTRGVCWCCERGIIVTIMIIRMYQGVENWTIFFLRAHTLPPLKRLGG